MCLTEPGAGSDLGDVKTKATKQPDGSYLLQGKRSSSPAATTTSPGTSSTPSGQDARSSYGSQRAQPIRGAQVPAEPDGTPGKPNDVHCAKDRAQDGNPRSPTCALVFGRTRVRGVPPGQRSATAPAHVSNDERRPVRGGYPGARHRIGRPPGRPRLHARAAPGRPHTDRTPTPPGAHREPSRRAADAALPGRHRPGDARHPHVHGWCMDMARVTEGPERELHQGMVRSSRPSARRVLRRGQPGFRQRHAVLRRLRLHWGVPRRAVREGLPHRGHLRGTNAIQALDLIGRKFKMKAGLPRPLRAGHRGDRLLLARRPRPRRSRRTPHHGHRHGQRGCGRIGPRRRSPTGLLNAVPFLESLGNCLGAHCSSRQAKIPESSGPESSPKKGWTGPTPTPQVLWPTMPTRVLQQQGSGTLFFCRRVLPLVKGARSSPGRGDLSPVEAFF